MLHWMIERGEDIHSVVFFDTGWEFPEMHDHIDLVEQKTGIEVVRLQPDMSFYDWMFNRRIVANSGHMKGKVHKIGYAWPTPKMRWCTGKKIERLSRYINNCGGETVCVGIAADEHHRAKKERYPLIEYGKTEADCLEYCKRLGYTWGGLYDVFSRVSCWCCPLQTDHELKMLRRHYPELWDQLMEWDLNQPRHYAGFRKGKTVAEWDERFHTADKQGLLWEVV